MQIIIAAKEHSITDVCRIHGLSRTTLTGWINRFKKDNVDALKNKPKKKKSPLNQHSETIQKWVAQNSNITAKELVIKLQESYGILTSVSSVYRMLKRLTLLYITPRPKHYKQDASSHEAFKKKSSTKN